MRFGPSNFWKFIITCILVWAVLFCVCRLRKKEFRAENCSIWKYLTDDYRRCLNKGLTELDVTEFWAEWANVVDSCLNGRSFRDMYFFKNKDDVKIAILPAFVDRQNCVAVTLGIGGDISAEEQLEYVVPGCRFFGADPVEIQGLVYKQIGKYTQVAVGGPTGGVINAQVLVGPGLNDYQRVSLPSVSLLDYLRTDVRRRRIDHLWIDNEGPEYDILPLLHTGAAVEQAGFEVCQVNVELHGPLRDYNMTARRFAETIRSLVAASSYLPLYVYAPRTHGRAFFFNVTSEHCVQKYFSLNCTA